MKVTLLLASSVALGALMSASALAQSNDAHIVQDGTANSATISQGGSLNIAGYNNFGSYGSDPILQDGDGNVLTINQTGNRNQAGISTVGSDYSGSGIDQVGNLNSLNIQQLTNGSKVHQVRQTASDAATTPTNVLKITQSSHSTDALISNRVNSVVQEHFGAAETNSATIAQHTTGSVNGQIIGNGSQTSNSSALGVVQRGSGNYLTAAQSGTGGANRIVYMLQKGNKNILTANQSGLGNLIGDSGDSTSAPTSGIQQVGISNMATVVQVGTSNQVVAITQHGNNNDVSLLFYGNSNGSAAFGSSFDDLGLAQGTAIQGESLVPGHSNHLRYNVTGNGNLFAFAQLGSSNAIDGEVDGGSNQVAVLQTGASNRSSFEQNGGSNSLSVSQ